MKPTEFDTRRFTSEYMAVAAWYDQVHTARRLCIDLDGWSYPTTQSESGLDVMAATIPCVMFERVIDVS